MWKSTDRAPSSRVLPWNLSYNWRKSMQFGPGEGPTIPRGINGIAFTREPRNHDTESKERLGKMCVLLYAVRHLPSYVR
jgi:hypothetical protein